MLNHIAEYLDGIPGRKNLIWVAGTFPLALGAQEGDSAYWDTEVKGELNGLAQAQIAIFPIDVGGVDFDSGSLVRYASEDIVAEATGGRAFYSRNDLDDVLVDATVEGANYYTLTYAPPSRMDDGTCHDIKVKVKPGNYKLSFRRYYCHVALVDAQATENRDSGAAAAVAVPLEAGDILQGNMKPGAPMLHDLIFSAQMRTQGNVRLATPEQMAILEQQSAFLRPQSGRKPLKPQPPVKVQTYVIDYRVLDPEFKAQAAAGKRPALELAVAAFDEDGNVLNGIVNDAMPDASPDTAAGSDSKPGVLRARQSLVVPVNAKSLRVGVRDRANDRMGTLEVSLPIGTDSARASTAH